MALCPCSFVGMGQKRKGPSACLATINLECWDKSAHRAPSWTLTAVPQVVVRLVQPVFARGIEYVEVDGIFERPGFMRQVRWDAQHFAGVNDDLLAIDGEFQRAFKDVGHLLV